MQGRSRWVIPFAAASVVSALTVWVVPLYRHSGRDGELRTMQRILRGEPDWMTSILVVIAFFPLLVAVALRFLGPEPRVWARALLGTGTLLYGACASLAMLMLSLEGTIFTLSGGTMRADDLVVDAAAWIAVLWWVAVGLAAAVFVFRKWT